MQINVKQTAWISTYMTVQNWTL